MENTKIITLLLSSSVLVALVTSYFNKLNQDKNIKIENITKERKEWREKIRELTKIINEKYYKQNLTEILPIISEFQIRLNPKDDFDLEIINTLYKLAKSNNDENNLIIKEFNSQISFLLKHDWERVKDEVKPCLFKFCRKKEFLRQTFSEDNIKIETNKLSLFIYFMTLTFSAGVIFFLSVGLTEPFIKYVKIFNNTEVNQSLNHWIDFIVGSIIAGSLWSATYLLFKGSEKRFLEIWFKR